MLLRVIDIETTGLEPPAEIIEIGWQDLVVESDRIEADKCGFRLFGAVNGVPPESRAVHHVNPALLEGLPPCSVDDLRKLSDADAIVAHNAAMEGQWFTPDILGDVPLICTYKAALRVWPDAPAHSNSVLRYWLNLDLLESRAMPPHRALPDTYVTAAILVELLTRGGATFADLVAWTAEPRLMPKVTFGKHRGKKWGEVPYDYLDWLFFKSDLDSDTKWNARREMDLRRKSA